MYGRRKSITIWLAAGTIFPRTCATGLQPCEKAPDAYIVGMPLPKADGFEGFVTQKSMGEPEWIIPAKAQDKAPATLKALDFFYDRSNDEFIRFGIEGQRHEVVDGKKCRFQRTAVRWRLACAT